ncbi:hypothetical protein [Beijerinckia sp. L45]|uniref:hypothetical protein n=1 Tax=Beijerinckia sp. L45 TaxID=1641855 RepID=UPI00131E5752|nr:hypothetical protein [Beijerinckia sp. L45]
MQNGDGTVDEPFDPPLGNPALLTEKIDGLAAQRLGQYGKIAALARPKLLHKAKAAIDRVFVGPVDTAIPAFLEIIDNEI